MTNHVDPRRGQNKVEEVWGETDFMSEAQWEEVEVEENTEAFYKGKS